MPSVTVTATYNHFPCQFTTEAADVLALLAFLNQLPAHGIHPPTPGGSHRFRPHGIHPPPSPTVLPHPALASNLYVRWQGQSLGVPSDMTWHWTGSDAEHRLWSVR